MPRQPGTRLGPYELLAPLGAGGMGEVYRARDTRLDRSVAIKLLPENLSHNPDLQKRFEREARAISSLSHPHICTLHDVGREDGAYFLVMEYLEGETLAARLMRGALPLDETLRYAIQIADALDKAHRSGVVHRDLKPGNIMLTKSGVKLLDFGLAKAADPRRSVELSAAPTATNPITAEGTIVGTVQYMAPEQLEGKEADARSDIFAFGAVLYEMATGKRAFEGSTQASLIAAIMKESPRPLGELAPMSPPALEHLVRTCMAKDAEQRYQSVHDVLLELNWHAQAGSQAGMPAPVVARRKTRELILAALASMFLLTTIAFAIGFVFRAPEPPRAFQFTIAPPTDLRFLGQAVISPDGKQLAFVAGGKLWVRPMDSVNARPLAGTEGSGAGIYGLLPFWSPDSRYLGFFADGKLKKIELAGGPPFVLCDAPNGRGGAWNKDGTIVFARATTGPLHQVSSSGGSSSPVTKLGSLRDETHRWPQFLPDGRHFVFLKGSNNPGGPGGADPEITVASLDSPETKILLREPSRPAYASGHLLFVHESTLLARPFDPKKMEFTGDAFPIAEPVDSGGDLFGGASFSVSGDGVLVYQATTLIGVAQLVWLDRSGKQLGVLGQAADYRNPRLSPDGSRLAVPVFDLKARPEISDVWVFEVARGIRNRLTFDDERESTVTWSPDGKRVAFNKQGAKVNELRQKGADGVGNEDTLVSSEPWKSLHHWSPDGRYIAYQSEQAPGKPPGIWILPLFGDRKPFLFHEAPFGEWEPQFSPDGRWLAYGSNQSGRNEVYVSPFPGGAGRWQISTDGGRVPRWRGDGREIFYLGSEGQFMSAQVSGKGSALEVGKAQPLFKVADLGSGYDITRDGQKFLCVVSTTPGAPTPVTVVVNWMELFKKE